MGCDFAVREVMGYRKTEGLTTMSTQQMPACGTTPVEDNHRAPPEPPAELAHTPADPSIVRVACDDGHAQSAWGLIRLAANKEVVVGQRHAAPLEVRGAGKVDVGDREGDVAAHGRRVAQPAADSFLLKTAAAKRRAGEPPRQVR